MLRNFKGHGFHGSSGYIDTVEIYQKGGVDPFLAAHANISPDFTAEWNRVIPRLLFIESELHAWGEPERTLRRAARILAGVHARRMESPELQAALTAGSRLYFAYGSNMDETQMLKRCAHPVPVGLARLDGYRLVSRQNKKNYYASLDEAKDGSVPVLVWALSDSDIETLDGYEPHYYYKKDVTARFGHKRLEGFVYLLPEDRERGRMGNTYRQTLLTAYRDLGLDDRIWQVEQMETEQADFRSVAE
ncbi:MAG: gamma-glutamylcyclotransferase family protein [Bacillota bacterium]|nr:gamma-glutamylcyclotransferase family protein [Bacillota bacterium]